MLTPGVGHFGYIRAVKLTAPRSVVVLAVLSLASVGLGHVLVYLVAHGFGAAYDRAMAEGGHGRYWTSFVLTATGVTIALAAVVVVQMRRLVRLSRLARAERIRMADERPGLFAGLLGRMWLRLAVTTLLLFLLQENLERIAAGQPAPLLEAIAGDHAIAVPVLTAVSFIVGAVAALVGWRRIILLARLAAARWRWGKAPAVRRPVAAPLRAISSDAARTHGVRAPPGALAAA